MPSVSPSDPRLAPATEDEIPLVVEIIREAFGPVAQRLGILEEDVPRYAAFESVPRMTMWMAEHEVTMFLLWDGEEAVGCGGCSADKDDPTRGHLNRIAVRPGCQGKGYGKAVVIGLEDELRKRGLVGVTLAHVSPDPPLHAFYEGLGYRTIGVEPSTLWGVELTFMEKDL